ncbi:hypothetical protein KKF61_04695 [Patescibacteria group bacterium]|nr:hypothetical protein [Patescibacteria group bacterium]MBU0964175.1 hypothetical protein [Patescibacteria group bacterium]
MDNNETKNISKKPWLMGVSLIVIGVLLGVFVFSYFFPIGMSWLPARALGMDEQRDHYLMHKEHMINELLDEGEYQCCLEKPCAYCLEKTPGHGEGASCHCLEDVVNGEHPCGECMGEILEGHGNPHLTEYFAESIAEEVGEEHMEDIQQIIDEKYVEEDCEEETVCDFDLDNLDQDDE